MEEKRRLFFFFFFCWSVETSLQRILSRTVLKIQAVDTEEVFFLYVPPKYSAVGSGMGRLLRMSRRQVQWPASYMVTVKAPGTQGAHMSRGSQSVWHKLAFQVRRVQQSIPRAKLAEAWIWWMRIGHVGQYLAAKQPPAQMVKARPQLSFWSGSKSYTDNSL